MTDLLLEKDWIKQSTEQKTLISQEIDPVQLLKEEYTLGQKARNKENKQEWIYRYLIVFCLLILVDFILNSFLINHSPIWFMSILGIHMIYLYFQMIWNRIASLVIFFVAIASFLFVTEMSEVKMFEFFWFIFPLIIFSQSLFIIRNIYFLIKWKPVNILIVLLAAIGSVLLFSDVPWDPLSTFMSPLRFITTFGVLLMLFVGIRYVLSIVKDLNSFQNDKPKTTW